MRRLRWMSWSLLACRVSAPDVPPPSDAHDEPPPAASVPPEPTRQSPPASPLGAPLSGPPRLVIENHSSAELRVYGLLVDERGERGTMTLWPDPNDCPDVEDAAPVVAAGQAIDLPPPSRAFASGCTSLPLPAGRYVLHLETGYGGSLFAAATFELPLVAPVRLAIANHGDEAVACDAVTAERAARLAFAALDGATLPKGFLDGCDAAAATCGSLPIPDDPPPSRCRITLRENLLVVERPPGDDTPLGFTTWLDPSITSAHAPELRRTSASVVGIHGKLVTFAGITNRSMHEHGGDAARIGSMRIAVTNPTSRALRYTVRGMQWLSDHGCGLPHEVRAKPAVTHTTPQTLPPGTSELEIGFEGQSAYQAHCDRFASRALLRVEGKDVAVTVEHEVTRIEPLRGH